MPSRSAAVSHVISGLFMLLAWGPWSYAAGPEPQAKPPGTPGQKAATATKVKPDWPAIRGLVEAGEYAKAAAAADAIVKLERPSPRDPDYVPLSIDRIEALMLRGFTELQLGQFDVADATFAEADAMFADRDLKKFFASARKQLAEQVDKAQNHLDLRAIELANVKAAVILARLRRARIEGASGENTVARSEALAILEATKGTLRDQLTKRLKDKAEAEATLYASPHKRALVSPFHQQLISGIAAFESAQLPGVQDSKGGIAKSLEHFASAKAALDKVFEATLPQGVASGPPDKRIEAIVLETELAVARCDALIRVGDIEQARQELERITELHKDLSKLRMLAKPDRHPDRFRPLVFSAEIALIDARKLLDQNDVDKGFAVAAQADSYLALAEALPLPTNHPLRGCIAPLAAAIRELRARLTSSIELSDMSDAAGGRVNRALETTAPSAYGL